MAHPLQGVHTPRINQDKGVPSPRINHGVPSPRINQDKVSHRDRSERSAGRALVDMVTSRRVLSDCHYFLQSYSQTRSACAAHGRRSQPCVPAACAKEQIFLKQR